MRVTSNTITNSLIQQIDKLTERQVELQKQVSSGQRVTRPSDDPAAMGRILEIQSGKRQLVQLRRNFVQAESLIRMGNNSLDSLRQLNIRAQEDSLRVSGVSSPEEMAAYARNVDQLLEQALQSANARFGGKYLFSGATTDTKPFVETRDISGKITGVAYVGSSSAPSYFVGEGTQISPYHDPADNGKFSDFLNRLAALRDALDAGDFSAVQSARTDLLSSEDDILLSISELGSKQLRLEVARAQDDTRYAEMNNRLSQEADVDLAQVILKLNKAQVAYQAALQSGSRIMYTSLLDYI